MIGSEMKSRSVLVVDRDLHVLDQVCNLLDTTHSVLATADPRRALGWLEREAMIAAIIVAQVLPGMSGLDLLQDAQKLRPDARRILIANFEDLASIIPSLHSGIVQRTISKPIDARELVSLLRVSPSLKQASDSPSAVSRA